MSAATLAANAASVTAVDARRAIEGERERHTYQCLYCKKLVHFHQLTDHEATCLARPIVTALWVDRIARARARETRLRLDDRYPLK
ncbi:MAG: hypothetical protein ABL982_00210 [Vicinamibacterales bacterium]